ncbi:MAG: DUF5615 family PIN-like protein [Promethearchaeota archaeon]
MKFLTDAMLGRLTRLLRVFGFDTVYAENVQPSAPDEVLLEHAIKNDRIIITKDYPFFKKAGDSRAIFLEGNDVYNYLSQLKDKLNLHYNFEMPNARCSLCNSDLKQVEDDSIIQKEVKPDTLKHYEEFFQCTNCGKVYWKGSHIEDILTKIKEKVNP